MPSSTLDDARPLAYSLPEAVRASGLSRSTLYEQIAAGKLRARKLGARTLILRTELETFLAGLPAMGDPDAS